ncbi:MAG TPA: ABC transporter ATP-binding protein [Candidatus Nanoarchaeia archaeon]|nr:ABC transporter ATP-binding protein [Candidatus Nanoarchaeia archaeon]
MKTKKSEAKRKPILHIDHLDSWYGQVQILHDVNIHVYPGEIVSIIGPNGAGKSTVLKNIFGLITKRKGEIMFNGSHIHLMPPNQIVKHGISIVPQGRSVFPSLSVLENLELGAYIMKQVNQGDLERVLKLFPVLRERLGQKAGMLSGGEQQMVAMGRSMMLNPKLLLLDEPTLGLSPGFKKLIFDKIIEINKKEGVTILMVEQNARKSLELSHRAYVLELGRNKLMGKGKELLHDKRVQKLYLGGG